MPRRRRWLRTTLLVSAALLVMGAALGFVYRGQLRGAARVGLEKLLASLLQGEVHIDRVDALGLGGIEATGATVLDPAGRPVLHAEHVSLGLAPLALLRGTLRFSHGRAENVRVRAYPSSSAGISLFEAFVPRSSSDAAPSGGGLGIRFEHIHVLGLTVRGDVPGLAGIDGRELEARGEILIDDDLLVRVWEARGALQAPETQPVAVQAATLDLRLTPFDLSLHARVRQRADALRIGLRYHDSPTPRGVVEPVLDVTAELAPLSTDLLTSFGVPGAAVLVPDLRGYVTLHGAPSSPSFRADLHSVAGDVTAHGSFGRAATRVHVSSANVVLSELVAYAPPIELAVSVDAERVGDAPVSLKVRAPTLSLYGLAFRDAQLDAVYTQDDRLEIARSHVQYAEGHFDVSGYVDADSRFALRIRSAVPEVGRDPAMRAAGVRAGLDSDATVSFSDGRLAIDGHLHLAHPSYRWLAADDLRLRGRVSFDGAMLPAGQLEVNARGLSLAGEPLAKLDFTARGAGGTYTLRAYADDPGSDRSLELDLGLHTDGSTYHFTSRAFTLAIEERAPWRGSADVTVDANELRFDSFHLEVDEQRLSLRGAYSYTHAYRLDATLARFDLGGLRELLRADLADLDGTVDGTLVLSGRPGAPRVDVQAHVVDGRYLRMQNLVLGLKLVYLDDAFDLDADLRLGDGSNIRVYADGKPGAGPDFVAQVAAGDYAYGLEFKDVPFSVATPWLAWYGITPPPGTLSAQLSAQGSLTDTRFALGLSVRGYEPRPGLTLDASADLRFDGSELSVQSLSLSDGHGALLRGSGRLASGFSELADVDALRASLAHRPWEFYLSAPERTSSSLPAELSLPAGLVLSGELHGQNTASAPTLDAQVLGRYSPDGARSCGSGSNVTLAADAHIRNGQADLVLDLVANGGGGGGRVRASAAPPLGAWLEGSAPVAPVPTQLSVQLSSPALEELPLFCEHAAGPLTLSLEARDVFANPPDLAFELSSKNLQLVPHEAQRQRLGNLSGARVLGRPLAVTIEGSVDDQAVHAVARVESETSGNGALTVTIPRSAFAPSPPPRPEPAELRLELRSFELAPVLVALPVASRVSGISQGNVRALYDVHTDKLSLAGSLGLQAGKLAIAALGQELQDLRMQLNFAGDEVRIAPLAARDLDGRVQLSGTVKLAGTEAARLGLQIDVRRFPLRREGTQVSRLTGTMDLTGDVLHDKTSLVLTLRDVKADIPSDLDVSVQSLDPHPAVVVAGTTPPPAPVAPYLYELRILAKKPPFRVLRSDLSAELTTDFLVRYREPSLTLEGSAQLERGNFELFGKRFELEPSSLVFDVPDTLDPLVSLHASHQIGGDTIGVRVDGRLSAPKVTFTHSNPSITDSGTIVGQLLGGRAYDPGRRDRDASGAAAGVLAGATAGLLTGEVQRQFGGALPSVSMESGGTTFRGTRIRAGVQLDQLIENRLGPLRKVVRGAYVEGFVTPGGTTTSSTNLPPQSRGGGLLELRFPRDLVGTIEYRPVQNWRVDLAWEP